MWGPLLLYCCLEVTTFPWRSSILEMVCRVSLQNHSLYNLLFFRLHVTCTSTATYVGVVVIWTAVQNTTIRIVFCVGVSKAPPVLYLSYSTGRRYLCSLRYLLCTYVYNKLLVAWEGVLYAEYSTRGQGLENNTAWGEAECCIVLSTPPLVLYCAYNTLSHAITIT